MTITEKQKLPENLEKLYAYQVLYTRVKLIRSMRMIITYFLALVAPFIILNNPGLKGLFAIIGPVWAVLALISASIEKNIQKEGAKIQEEFDTSVFEIDWNKILVGERVSQETIINLKRAYKGAAHDDWYGNIDGIPPLFDVAVCQRSNAVWDWRLRRTYLRICVPLLVAIGVGGVLLAVSSHLYLEDYIKMIFFPQLSAFILGYKEMMEHYDNYIGRSGLEKKLNKYLEETILNKTIPEKFILRQVQDQIYIFRKCTATIPDFFQGFLRKRYNRIMQDIINKYSDQLKNIHDT